jgi:hypothetical protein
MSEKQAGRAPYQLIDDWNAARKWPGGEQKHKSPVRGDIWTENIRFNVCSGCIGAPAQGLSEDTIGHQSAWSDQALVATNGSDEPPVEKNDTQARKEQVDGIDHKDDFDGSHDWYDWSNGSFPGLPKPRGWRLLYRDARYRGLQ